MMGFAARYPHALRRFWVPGRLSATIPRVDGIDGSDAALAGLDVDALLVARSLPGGDGGAFGLVAADVGEAKAVHLAV